MLEVMVCSIHVIVFIVMLIYCYNKLKPKNKEPNINKEPVDKIDRLEQYYETQIKLKSTHMISEFYQECLDKLREIKKEKDNTTDILKSYAEFIKYEYDLAIRNIDVCWKEDMVGTSRYSGMCLIKSWYGSELTNLKSSYGVKISSSGDVYIC